MNIERVLFDLDGTLFDTQKYHAAIESEILRELGINISPEEITERYASMQVKKIFMLLGCDESTAEQCAKRKWKKIDKYAALARPLADLSSLFSLLQERGIGFSIGTSSPSAWAKSLLGRHGMLKLFDDNTIVGREHVILGKPNPEVWQRASVGVSSNQCLVVEDGVAGIEAAVAANMPSCLLLPARHHLATSITRVDDIISLL